MKQSITLDEFAGQTLTHALKTPSTQAPKETWFKARCNASKRVCLSNARQVYRFGLRLFDRAGMKDAPDQARSCGGSSSEASRIDLRRFDALFTDAGDERSHPAFLHLHTVLFDFPGVERN
jgi:hypothetical protein